MKKLLILLLFCPMIGISQQGLTIVDSLIHNGVSRSYILYIPSSYTSNVASPLVFNFHGLTSDANSQMWYGDFRGIADTANFIIVHPQGLLNNLGQTHWNVGQSAGIDDVGFTETLLDLLSTQYNINLDRVYSTGMSNGGYMSYHLACTLNDKIAAIASVTGAMSQYTQIICNPVHPTPVLEIHGTADAIVSFNAILSGLQYWYNYNNCNSIADTTSIPDINFFDGSTVEHIVYNGGDNGVTTELFKIDGGMHTWPGSFFGSTGTNYDIDASVEIWKFFSRYDINGLIGNNTLITDVTIDDNDVVKVIDILGRKINEKRNTLLFYIYDDGEVEKKIIIE